jgi:hypothetical protein
MGFSGPSITKFIELKDTPTSYTNQSTKLLRVNIAENSVEFIDVRDVLNMMKPFITLELDTGFLETVTGSGYRWAGKFETTILTGTTANSTTGYVSFFPIWHDYTTPGNRWQFACRLEAGDTTDMLEYFVGFFQTNNTYPTLTSQHYGFRLISTSDGVNAKLQATCGNGTNGTQLDIIDSISPGQKIYLIAQYFNEGIKYFYSFDSKTFTLGATITTNRPIYVSMFPGFWIKNFEAVDKRVKLHTFKISEAD